MTGKNCCFCTEGCSACPVLKPVILRSVAFGAVGASIALAIGTTIRGDAPLCFTVCGKGSMMVPPSCSKYAFPTMGVSCLVGLEVIFKRLKAVCCSEEKPPSAEQRRKCLHASAVSITTGAVAVAVAQYYSYGIANKELEKMPCGIASGLVVAAVLPLLMLVSGCCFKGCCFKGCCCFSQKKEEKKEEKKE